MLKNILTVALRGLRRNLAYTTLNVLGLAVGLACCILVFLYIGDELSYDRFHEHADRIVRVGTDFEVDGVVRPSALSQGLLAPVLEDDLPEVEHAVRVIGGDFVLRVGDEVFQETNVAYVDSTFFEVFDGFRLLRGDAATALDAPGQTVLSESLARKYFGDADPLGQTLRDRERALTVTGVMADPPPQSHLRLDAVVSLSTAADPGWWYQNWFSINFTTYTLLRPGTDFAAFEAKLPALAERHGGEEMEAQGNTVAVRPERLTDLDLRSDRSAAWARGDLGALRIFGAIALFVLLIACVNFTNLATARSLDRAKEVGVRKTLGAYRAQLGAQFLAESVLLSGIALVVALGLVATALPAFNALTEKSLALTDLGRWGPALILVAVLVGLFAGAYPALVLSGFEPAAVLKGRFSRGRQGVALRQSLVVLQFAISVALIAATAIVFGQLGYMQSRDLGFDAGSDATGQLLTIEFGGDAAVQERLDAIKQRFAAHPAVTGVTSSLSVPTGMQPRAGGEIERPEGGRRDFNIEPYLVDEAFVDVFGLEIVAGVAPGPGLVSDSLAAYVLNETAVREAGFPSNEAVLGKAASFWGYDGEVVGVVRDFHTRGVQQAVEPGGIVVTDLYQSVLTLRVRTTGLPDTMRDLEAIWADVAPQRPFTSTFLDEAFAAQYAAERRFGQVFGVLAGLAIFIACLGLFGLAAYAVQQRTKEIGIRKVLGASAPDVVVLLTKDVLALVGIAFVVAVPVVWVGMDRWLDGFAYRIDLGALPFALAGAAALAIALATVSVHTLRAATADPVQALRAE